MTVPQHLKTLAVDDLMGLIAAFEKYASLFKRRKESLEGGLKCRYLEVAQSALRKTHRDTGRTSITGGFYIIRELTPAHFQTDGIYIEEAYIMQRRLLCRPFLYRFLIKQPLGQLREAFFRSGFQKICVWPGQFLDSNRYMDS